MRFLETDGFRWMARSGNRELRTWPLRDGPHSQFLLVVRAVFSHRSLRSPHRLDFGLREIDTLGHPFGRYCRLDDTDDWAHRRRLARVAGRSSGQAKGLSRAGGTKLTQVDRAGLATPGAAESLG